MGSLIKKEHINVNFLGKDQREVIEMASCSFIKNGIVKNGFIDAVIKREEKYPTGLPTKIGVALPHTELDYVIKEGISILTLEKPIVFYEMGNPKEKVDVEIIFLLAIINPQNQIHILQKIVSMIQDEKVLNKIKSAKSSETIYNLVNQFIAWEEN
jgi:PTS system galactitol-specific IIA component